ncbi:metallophosphoesterase [Microbulbifer sp. ALW1]|uniref:STAND family AAA ATPase n=1 Tax=Microbulbifer sp. (strain ALW1) TaxID=1516059 RepID=UPI001358039E|nr:metallophosphoesterase [Microbulbifer sp. ALW1]
MTFCVLHLSDIHIKSSFNQAHVNTKEIYSSLSNLTGDIDCCLIIVSGDIAFSGKKAEYELASTLLSTIKNEILEKYKIATHIVVAPGNHDCDFSKACSIRNIVIDSLASNPEQANDESIIEKCTEVQSDFFAFRDKISTLKPIFEHKLWVDYLIPVAGKSVKISVINAAWMSKLKEKQGELTFPIEKFSHVKNCDSDLRIAVIHHPLNWYGQQSYHPLRKSLRRDFDAVFSGHEHNTSSGLIDESDHGKSLYFESSALQSCEPGVSDGFSCIKFDLTNASASESRYVFSGEKAIVESEKSFPILPLSENSELKKTALHESIIEEFMDAGGNFSHPEKKIIEAKDVFVYPELEDKQSVERRTISASQIKLEPNKNTKILVLGEDKSGKSFLLKKMYLDAHGSGLLPVYFDSFDFKSSSQHELSNTLKRKIEKQYKDPNTYSTSEIGKKIAFIDGFDRLPGSIKNKDKIIKFIEAKFDSVIISGSGEIELNELIDKSLSKTFSEYDTYEIKNFGYQLRHELIKNWCMCGNIETKQELDKKVHSVETLINTVIGKNLVPPRPIYILILLQSCENQQEGELENAGFAYYYQYLITKSLKECGVRNDQLNEIFNYLSNLAWFYRCEETKEIYTNKLREFNKIFSEKYTSVDFDNRLKLLTRAKILSASDGFYTFPYPYVYYFFVGKYLAQKLHDEQIKGLVGGLCENLNKRENSGIILFLSHHVNDSWLTDQVSFALQKCFADVAELDLDNDVESLNALVASSAELVIEEIDVERSQVEQRKAADAIEDDGDNTEDSDDSDANEAIDISKKFNLLIKTAEILGQITKNYYGSIERSKKSEYLKEVFGGPLRLLRFVLEETLRDPESLVKDIERAISDKVKKIDDIDELSRLSQKAAFEVVGMICTGLIAKTALFVTSDRLREDISAVVRDDGSISYRLFEAATELVRPGRLPIDQLKKLSRDLRANTFSFKILQTLVAYHLHMFHTTDLDKQKLCDLANITMSNARSIDVKSKKTRLINRSRSTIDA